MPEVNDLREKLAALAHDSWSGWTRCMFSKCTGQIDFDGMYLVIPRELAERWKRQMDTPYADLTESEKASDRVEADKVLALLEDR